MKFGTVDIPNSLLDDLHNNKVVVFAGAGVSRGEPACFPNFESLTTIIAKGTVYAKSESENLEQFLGRLDDRDVKVHHLAKTELSREGAKPTPLHRGLLKLYRKDQSIRLVTTNFDLLFEQAAKEMSGNTPEVFHAPMLPFGHQLNGIIHLHGSICYPDQMVLTDRDFGRAYLREAWATRFLLDLYDKYTFLFIGYSHSDTVMNYLVRSLPPKAHSSHYALVADSKDADHRHWGSLEIEMITYPQHENDHRELDEVISKLANHVQRGMVGWHREISAIAEKHPHELNEEEKGLIDYALKDKTKTEFFTKSASHPEWIEWLDTCGHLTPLFGIDRLRDSSRILSLWLADRYLENHPNLIFRLISRHRTRVHPRFWDHIARKVGRDNETSPNTTILSQWITLLLSTAPEEGETPDKGYVFTSDHLATIARRCITHQMIEEVLLIFDAMIRSRLSIRENHYLPRSETEEDLQFRKAFQIRLDVPLVGQHEQLDELWDKGLKPNLSKISQPLFERAIWCLENQYLFYRTWGRATRLLEHASEMRSAIEPHAQNVGGHDTDVVIDAARDCLDWLATHEPKVAAQWCSRLVASDAPLLRRLAVHSLSKREDLAPDGKIQWLLKHIDLHEYSIHHEVYHAIRHAYPDVGSDCRRTLIEKVRSYRFPHEEHPDNEEVTARGHFDWFDWLHKSDPNCALAEQARDEVLAEYRHFTPREHPDFTSYIHSGHVDIPSPLTPEDLPANPTADSIIQFSSYEGATLRQEIERLKESIEQDFDKGLNVVNTLADAGQWDDYRWRVLFDTWSKMELDLNKHRQVLECFARTELYSKYSYEIADWLYALVKKGGPSYAFQLLLQANKIAVALWKNLDRTISIDAKHGWFNSSVNYPVWALTNFWLHAAQIWREQQNPPPATLSEDYHRPLLEIIRDSSPIGGLGKSILASKLDFLLAVDEEWTREHLLPLFEPDSADFQAAWDGFVSVKRLSLPVAEALKNQFLKAVTRISDGLFNQRRGFVKCYTVMFKYVADEVLDTWIPQLFEHGSHQSLPASREPTLFRDDNYTIPEIFALEMIRRLKEMSDSDKQKLWHRWLKDYWQNRLYGKPAPLTPNEAGVMLDWLPEFNTEFLDAVNLAIQMYSPSLDNMRILACLVTNKTWENHPKAVAKLLIYLWGCTIPAWHRDTVPEIIPPLLESDISPELKQKLEDIKVQL